MDEEYIHKFNMARSFLYLHGYLTDSENEKVKSRFKKEAKKKGIDLESRPLASMPINQPNQ